MGAVLQRYIRLIGPNVIKADKPYTLGFSVVRARIRDDLLSSEAFEAKAKRCPGRLRCVALVLDRPCDAIAYLTLLV
jgi:hypothetical protein